MKNNKKRIFAAIICIPFTLLFTGLWRFLEWFHFNVSGMSLNWCRSFDRKLDKFFTKFD